ncbi:hypothetical protein [Pseudomonas gozinkensis]|uniref:hypothetical protein n=1 Tax=Pseudomonas gozinkensis TaxID=2774461 RepID=UPI0017882F25|nr:hypothetical protein [Pseudomonas gozinkensis]
MNKKVEVDECEITEVTNLKGKLIERGGETSDRTLIIRGKAYRDAKVTIEDDFLTRAEVRSDPTGNWNVTLENLPEGERYFEAVVDGKRSKSWIVFIV